MMSNEMAFIALSSLLSILGIFYLLFWRYRIYRCDSFRQELFELRDELYDFAAEGNIDFSHPAYGVLRSTINGFIRFGHRLNLWQFILFLILIRKEDLPSETSFERVWSRATNTLNEETSERLKGFRQRMDHAVMKYAFTAAPEFFLLIPLVVACLIALALWKLSVSLVSHRGQTLDAWGSLRKRFSDIDDAALLFGEGGN